MTAAKKPAARANSAKKKPTEHVELPKPEALKSPYPEGVQYYSYQPEDGSEPILLALDGFPTPDKLWHFDTAQLPLLSQTWKWMAHANIPKAIQRRAQMLPDAEYFKMFDEWFDIMKQIRGSGPKGAVTVGK